jgi:hypothetical protein
MEFMICGVQPRLFGRDLRRIELKLSSDGGHALPMFLFKCLPTLSAQNIHLREIGIDLRRATLYRTHTCHADGFCDKRSSLTTSRLPVPTLPPFPAMVDFQLPHHCINANDLCEYSRLPNLHYFAVKVTNSLWPGSSAFCSCQNWKQRTKQEEICHFKHL